MKHPRPPRLATWLLQKLAPEYCAESFAGDLLEEFYAGKGNAWYWRQVLTAILLNGWRFLNTTALTFFAALAAAWAVYWLGGFPMHYVQIFASHVSRKVSWWLGVDPFAYRVAGGLTIAIIWGAIAILFVAQGYVMGRVHRRFHKTALLLFFCLFTVAPAWWNISHRLVNAVRYPSGAWLESAVAPLLMITLKLVCLAIGGLWLARRESADQSTADPGATTRCSPALRSSTPRAF
jgi:hypothetical protein